jgi:hypothetical protein
VTLGEPGLDAILTLDEPVERLVALFDLDVDAEPGSPSAVALREIAGDLAMRSYPRIYS